ncbi:MAG: hypothetical protein JWL85_310 [Candidatus Saccharibacteria bacterium]|nr:hypothetical protein [Candidatus Saccharibacteria bacterium]
MTKSKLKKAKNVRFLPGIMSAFMALVLISGFVLSPIVQADRFQDEINALNAENSVKQGEKRQLAVEADSFESTIAALQGQISGIEGQIRSNQDKMGNLQIQINEAEAELAKQKKLLGENIKAMYLEGQITTLEMLASSKDLSEYVDKEQYRDSVKTKIKKTLDKINLLKAELKKQKDQLERLINEQKAMQADLASQRAEVERLLNLNASQRSALDTQIKGNNSKIVELRRAQAIENARLFGNGLIRTDRCDIYPQRWCNAPMDAIVDTWGMYNRQCVSWTAFKVAMSGRHMPYWGGYGNANQWDDNARAEGIPVDRNPREGDVAVSNSGYYGHVMYVEAVYGDGTLLISQFNADWNGTYSMARINVGNLVFIHFP